MGNCYVLKLIVKELWFNFICLGVDLFSISNGVIVNSLKCLNLFCLLIVNSGENVYCFLFFFLYLELVVFIMI